MRRVNNEWLEGEAQKNGAVGMFPLSFVEIVEEFKEEGMAGEVAEQSGVGYEIILKLHNLIRPDPNPNSASPPFSTSLMLATTTSCR